MLWLLAVLFCLSSLLLAGLRFGWLSSMKAIRTADVYFDLILLNTASAGILVELTLLTAVLWLLAVLFCLSLSLLLAGLRFGWLAGCRIRRLLLPIFRRR